MLIGSVYEYYRLIAKTGTQPQSIAGIITALTAYVISGLVAAGIVNFEYYLIIVVEVLYIIIIELYRNQDRPFDALAHTVFGIIFISVPFSLFPFLAYGFDGPGTLINGNITGFTPGLITGFMVLSWGFDIGAYLFGSYFGKHKLLERISPEKSWEGFIFGFIITVLLAWPVSLWFKFPGTGDWIIIGILIAVTGTLGDLVESMLKRSVGVKDSGSLLPGHGGLLDRFDSLILSLPFVYLYILLFT